MREGTFVVCTLPDVEREEKTSSHVTVTIQENRDLTLALLQGPCQGPSNGRWYPVVPPIWNAFALLVAN
jgi:hypothetical protein